MATIRLGKDVGLLPRERLGTEADLAVRTADPTLPESQGDSLELRVDVQSRRPSGLRKTTITLNSLAHRTTWLRSDLKDVGLLPRERLGTEAELAVRTADPALPEGQGHSLELREVGGQAVLGRQL